MGRISKSARPKQPATTEIEREMQARRKGQNYPGPGGKWIMSQGRDRERPLVLQNIRDPKRKPGKGKPRSGMGVAIDKAKKR